MIDGWRYFLLCALVALVTPCVADSGGARAVASVKPLERDFGQVSQGEVVSEEFTVYNPGNAPLQIKNVRFSNPGMKIRVQQQIKPSESVTLHLILDTSRYSGDVVGSAQLTTNDPAQPEVLVSLSGKVIAPVDILPHPAIYLSQYQGENASRSVMVLNNRSRPLNITRVEPKGSHFDSKIEVIEAGKSFLLTATVPAETEPGRYREAVVLHTDAADKPHIGIAVNVLVKPDIYLSPASADFGDVSMAKIARSPGTLKLLQQTFLLKRRSGDMAITDITTDIPFLRINNEPQLRSQNFKIYIDLDPLTLKLGKFSGAIRLTTDDPDTPHLTIPVSGIIRP